MRFFGLAGAMALAMPLTACLDGSDLCDNDVVSRIVAPGGAHVAVMFERSCGATTGFSTQVSILRSGEVSAGKGNAFVADDDHGAAMAGDWGGPWAEIRWIAPDLLLVRHAAGVRIFLQNETVSGVRITYRTTNEL